MQNRARIMAICGICGAISTICLLCLGIPGANWIGLVLAVLASVAVAIPTMASGKVGYSLITYFVSGVIGVWTNLSRAMYLAPVVGFCMPMAIIKITAETLKISAKTEHKTIDDPFGNGDDKKVIAVAFDARQRMNNVVKWILYYVVLEIGIVATLFATYLLMPTTFQAIYQHKLFLVLLAVLQLLPIPYDMLLRGAFALTAKTLRRYLSQD